MIDQSRIAQCNAANASAMFLQESLREILTPYLNRKAWKISGYGGPVAALERDLQALQTQGHFFLQKSVSWLYCTLRNDRERVEISLGKVSEDGVLLELFDTQARRTDYTLEEVNDKLAQARDLENQAQELRASIREFTR